VGSTDLLQFAIFIGLILLATPILGAYMARVFSAEKTPLSVVLRPVERIIYKICGVREELEEHWLRYAGHLLLFSAIGTIVTYAMLRLQQYLPLNPRALPAMSPDLAMNTAISFNTNTNWPWCAAWPGERPRPSAISMSI
jgi:K+-transporting ATPase ATPase A chain